MQAGPVLWDSAAHLQAGVDLQSTQTVCVHMCIKFAFPTNAVIVADLVPAEGTHRAGIELVVSLLILLGILNVKVH